MWPFSYPESTLGKTISLIPAKQARNERSDRNCKEQTVILWPLQPKPNVWGQDAQKRERQLSWIWCQLDCEGLSVDKIGLGLSIWTCIVPWERPTSTDTFVADGSQHYKPTCRTFIGFVEGGPIWGVLKFVISIYLILCVCLCVCKEEDWLRRQGCPSQS